MANEEQLRILKQGVEVWNRWREDNPNIKPDLRNACLKGINLTGVYLEYSNLKGVNFSNTNLNNAHLEYSNLKGANLSNAYLYHANLNSTNLKDVNLEGANFTGASLKKADFSGAKCGVQRFWGILLVIIACLLVAISGFGASLAGIAYSLNIPKGRDSALLFFTLLYVLFVSYIGFYRTGIKTTLLTTIVCVIAIIVIAALTIKTGVNLQLISLIASTAIALIVTGVVAVAVVIADLAKLNGIVAGILATVSAGVLAKQGASIFLDSLSSDATIIVVAEAATLAGWYIGWVVLRENAKNAKQYTWICFIPNSLAAIGGTIFCYSDLTESNFTGAIIKSANFRHATLTRTRWYGARMTNFACYGDSYLKCYEVKQWLIGKGKEKNFDSQNLGGVNLQGFDLSYASFIRTNISEADLSESILTGATIEDWNIDSHTKLDNVVCDYIYLKKGLQERRPSDPNRNFKPGEFAALVQKSLETVDLIFKDGIDWRAFLSSYKDIQIEYGNENVSIQAIEKKSDDAFVIRLNVPPEADKAEIESQIKHSYETKLQVLEAQYRAELQAKNTEINIYKQQSADMMEIVKLQASRTINVETNVVETQDHRNINQDLKGASVGSAYTEKIEAEQVGGTIINEAQKQTLAEAADEIQKLLEQLSQTYPTNTTTEQMVVATEAIKSIESNPSFKQKVINAAKEAGLAAFEKALDSTAGAFITGAVRGWLEAEA